MKEILSHIRKSWYKYLLEVFVITFGILLAFSLNTWKEEKKLKQVEIGHLKAMLSSVETIIRDDYSSFKREGNIYIAAKTMQFVIDSDLQFSDTLDRSLRWVEHYSEIWWDLSAFESLKQIGINTISNDLLARELQLNFTLGVEKALTLQNARIRKVHGLIQYDWYTSDRPRIPVDFEKLKDDVHFRRLVNFQIGASEARKRVYSDTAAYSWPFMSKWIKKEIEFLEGKIEVDYWDELIEPYGDFDSEQVEH